MKCEYRVTKCDPSTRDEWGESTGMERQHEVGPS